MHDNHASWRAGVGARSAVLIAGLLVGCSGGAMPDAVVVPPGDASVMESPTPESMAAALNRVMPAAKPCVSGGEAISRADLTFVSDGTVSQVVVTGWAADHGQSECVRSALSAARVQQFRKPMYKVGVTIRP